MNHRLNRGSGFTLVELIIVIAVIGVLATISLVGFSRYQGDTRDARRASSASVITEALEKYYDQNGEYPSCSALKSGTVTKDTLVGVDTGTLITPQAASSTSNSIKCSSDGNSLSVNGVDFFEYQGDGSADCNGTGSCLSFTLKYRDETNGQIKTISSRRSSSIATSGSVTNLVATSNSFTAANLTWGQIQNATSYDIQRATDTNFTASVVTVSNTANSATINGLSAGITYYFRVRPVGSVGTASGWSNTAQATTLSLSTPTLTMTNNSSTQATASWPAVTYAASYTLQYSTNGSFAPNTSTAGITTTSSALTGLTPGVTYYARVQAIAPADTSNWSTTKSFTLVVSPPTATPTVSASLIASNTVARGTAGGSGTCGSGSTLRYEMQYNSTNVGADGSWSAWTVVSNTMDISALQGNKYTFQVRSICIGSNANSAYSATSSSQNVVAPISTPSAPTWALTTEWAAGYNYNMFYGWSCPSGTNIGPEGVVSYYTGNGVVKSTPWIDWWYVGWNSGQFDLYRSYTAYYRCQTVYDSTTSPSTTTTIHAYCPPARRSTGSYPRCDNYGQGQGGNGNGNY